MTQNGEVRQIEQLSSQIAQLGSLLDVFHQTLVSESEALKSNSTEQLNDIIPQKQQQAEELTAFTQTLEQQLNASNTSLSTLLNSEDRACYSPDFQKQLKHVADLTNQCHDLNLANGISIQILSNINQHSIDLLSGQDQPPVKLYSASGEKTATKGGRKTLGKA